MNKNESGRSMVEMLGVLAIIGVLSIGCMTGYTLAMDRYRAEQIFNAATRLSATTTGGAVSKHSETVNEVRLTLTPDGYVCIGWGNVSSDIRDILETRLSPYPKKSINGDVCVNFKAQINPKFKDSK